MVIPQSRTLPTFHSTSPVTLPVELLQLPYRGEDTGPSHVNPPQGLQRREERDTFNRRSSLWMVSKGCPGGGIYTSRGSLVSRGGRSRGKGQR